MRMHVYTTVHICMFVLDAALYVYWICVCDACHTGNPIDVNAHYIHMCVFV